MKKLSVESVVRDWVSLLPFMQQALLMTAMRGPDGLPKYNAAKDIVKFIRFAVLNPAGEMIGSNQDKFMWNDFTTFDNAQYRFFHDPDQYPMHFIMHLVHAAQVVGYNHPDKTIAGCFFRFYLASCDSFHMNPETKQEMDKRMNK